jgi:hypothetical protein
MATRRMALLGLGVLCVLVSACSGGSPARTASGKSATTVTRPSKETTTSSAPAGTGSTTTTAGPSSGAGAGAVTTTTQVPPCGGPDLSVSGRQAPGAAGHQGVIILFENNGMAPCTLYGYPGVAGLNPGGVQVVQAERTLTGMMGGLAPGVTTIPIVMLSPGQTGSAVVEGTDVPSGTETGCPSYPSLLVTTPNTTESVRIPLGLPGCSPLEVHPVVAGTSGSTQF